MDAFPTIESQYENYAKALAQANALNKTAIFDFLTRMRISTITAEFNGESDSGQIEEVIAYIDETSQQVPTATVRFHHVSWGSSHADTIDLSLDEALKTLCYHYLSQEHDGWENNDGGYGTFTFNVSERKIELDFNARFTDSVPFGHTF